MKDKELKLEETEDSHTLGGVGECRVQGTGMGIGWMVDLDTPGGGGGKSLEGCLKGVIRCAGWTRTLRRGVDLS
jgi:hypothetical protein